MLLLIILPCVEIKINILVIFKMQKKRERERERERKQVYISLPLLRATVYGDSTFIRKAAKIQNR